MSRIARPVAVLAILFASLFVLAACGGDDKSGSDSYKQDAKAVVLAVRATGDTVGTVMSNADKTTDAALTQQLDALQKTSAATLAKITALEPPQDTDKRLVDALKAAYTKVNTDIVKIADAATANDPTGARSATEQLVADSPAVKAANNALGTSVGVPPRPTTTATTPTDGGTDFVTAATAVTKRIAALGNAIEKTIKGAEGNTDAALAKELADEEDEALAAIGDIKALQPPTAEYRQLVDDLNAAMQTIDGDLGSLSSSVAAHNVDGARSGTQKLLKDAPAVAKANNALADATRTS